SARGGIHSGFRCAVRRSSVARGSGGRRGSRGEVCVHVRNRRAHVSSRSAGHERVRARRTPCLPHVLHLCARTRQHLGHVPLARPRPQRTQRDGPLVAPPRRVRQELSRGVSITTATGMLSNQSPSPTARRNVRNGTTLQIPTYRIYGRYWG